MTRPRIMSAPTGARRQKSDHPGIPLSVEEIAAQAAQVAAAGADDIHLHVREDDGSHSLDAGRYRAVLEAVADAAPSLTRQITTESAGVFSPQQQYDCLDAVNPAYATVCIRESMRNETVARRLYAMAAEREMRIQHILFDLKDAAQLQDAYARDVVTADGREVIFVLGAYAPQRDGIAADLAPLLDATKDMDLNWMVCCFGRHEQAALTEAMRLGGHARIGFENNIYLPNGDLAESNAAQVAALAAIRDQLTEAA